MRRTGSARLVCVARYAPGFLHRENVDDFIFAKEDPNQSGHPIRITMFKPPKDGSLGKRGLRLCELVAHDPKARVTKLLKISHPVGGTYLPSTVAAAVR